MVVRLLPGLAASVASHAKRGAAAKFPSALGAVLVNAITPTVQLPCALTTTQVNVLAPSVSFASIKDSQSFPNSSAKSAGAAASANTNANQPSAKSAAAAESASKERDLGFPMQAHLDERLKFLESLFTEQSSKNAADLERLHAALHLLASKVGSELSLRDLKYYIVDGKKPNAPNKLHQLKTACSLAPSWA